MADRDAHKKKARAVTPADDKFNVLQPIFSQNEFDKAIESKGYDVFIEKGMRCPCYIKNSAAANPMCLNCGGTGWFFFGKKSTVAVIQSMNRRTKFLNWSETDRGTIQVTVKGIDRVAFMDRVTVLEVESIFSQASLVFKTNLDKYVSFLIYSPTEIDSCFIYDSFDQPLLYLRKDVNFSVVEDRLEFNDTIIQYLDSEQEAQITVRYFHHPTFHIIDINREIVKTFSYDDRFDEDKELPVLNQEQINPAFVKQLMPVNSVARKVHFMLDSPNASGESLYDNTPPDVS